MPSPLPGSARAEAERRRLVYSIDEGRRRKKKGGEENEGDDGM